MRENEVKNVEVESAEVEGYEVDPLFACDADCAWPPNPAVFTTEH